MIGHLGLERSFQNRFGQLLEQTVFPDDILGLLVVGEQLINQLLVDCHGVFHFLPPIAVYTVLFTPSPAKNYRFAATITCFVNASAASASVKSSRTLRKSLRYSFSCTAIVLKKSALPFTFTSMTVSSHWFAESSVCSTLNWPPFSRCPSNPPANFTSAMSRPRIRTSLCCVPCTHISPSIAW